MRKKLAVGVGVSSVLALTLGAALPAMADIQPNSTDVVGVGSDTVQYVGDFLNDGYNKGQFPLTGYNTTAKVNRIFSFDATSDAAGRAQYGATGNTGSGPFAAAAVLRQGDFPLYRAQGSGDGYKDLINDTTIHTTSSAAGPYTIDFVRASRLPKAAEQTAMGKALNPGCGVAPAAACPTTGIHVYQIATDGLAMAVNNKALPAAAPAGSPITCMPANVSQPLLSNIYNGSYQIWSDLYTAGGFTSPGANCPNEPIVPLTPDQAKSGTGTDFFNDMKGTSTTYAYDARVIKVEEHDPAALYASGNIAVTNHCTPAPCSVATAYFPEDVVAPFSIGRYNLVQTGYFDHTQDIHGGAASVLANAIALQTTAAPTCTQGAGCVYFKARTLYIAVREPALTSTTKFLPGGALNWVDTFFGPGSATTAAGWYAKPANAGLFTAAGVTQAYNDLNNASAG